MRLSVPISPFQGVAPGQTATAQLPVGRRYHGIDLVYGGGTFTPAKMNRIKVIANGEIIHDYTGTQLDTLNQFDGRAAANGILRIPFDRFNLLQREQEEVTALNTGVKDARGVMISTLSLEIDIDATAVAPTLSAFAEQSLARPMGSGETHLINRLRKFTRTAGGAGTLDIADIPGGVSGANPSAVALNRMFMFSGNVTALVIKRDNFTVFERTLARNNVILTDGVRAPQANVYAYDTTEMGYGGDILQLAGFQDIRYQLTMSGAATFDIIGEFFGGLEG